MPLPIQIIKVCSRSTGREYFAAFPQADTDMVTDGLLILVSKERDEIQMHMASIEEYRLGPFAGAKKRAELENLEQNRQDLAAFAIDLSTAPSPGSCSRFAYHDAMDENGHADVIEWISVDEFRSSGGRIEDRR